MPPVTLQQTGFLLLDQQSICQGPGVLLEVSTPPNSWDAEQVPWTGCEDVLPHLAVSTTECAFQEQEYGQLSTSTPPGCGLSLESCHVK